MLFKELDVPALHVTDRSGDRRTIHAASGLSLMEALREHGFDEIEAQCGGCCSCATCHIYLMPPVAADVPAPCEDEDDLLAGAEARHAHSRLSCQVTLTTALDNACIVIAPED